MTIRSWDRTQYLGQASVGHPQPYFRQVYAQNGTDTPRAMLAEGLFQENAYNLSVSDVLYPPAVAGFGPFQYQTGVNRWSVAPTYAAVVPVPYADVIPRLLEKWRQSSFNAGVTIGEGRESVQMMVNRLRSIADAARQIRRGNVGGAIRALGGGGQGGGGRRSQRRLDLGDLSGAFLELELGWKPLIRDIYALADAVKLKPKVERIRASSKNEVLSGTATYGRLLILRNEKRLHLTVDVTSAPTIYERFGLTNPLIIAWELVPLSFVADWFLPIQKNLESYHAIAAMKVARCIETRVEKRDARNSLDAGETYGSFKCISTGGAAKFHHCSVSRVIASGLPSAWAITAQIPLSVISDISNWDVDLRKLALGAALAHQRLRRLM